MPGLIDHLEGVLGPIQEGWSDGPDGVRMPFQIVRFDVGSGPGTISFSTLGLNRHPLSSVTSGREIRHEILMVVPESLRKGSVPSLLLQAGKTALANGSALLRGDVLGPQGPLVAGSSMEALYVSIPVYWPDSFATCVEDGKDVVIAWLIPISSSEAEYVSQYGWNAFEDRLAEADPDLTDIFRTPIKL
jgi:suppressor of fused protein SUFU